MASGRKTDFYVVTFNLTRWSRVLRETETAVILRAFPTRAIRLSSLGVEFESTEREISKLSKRQFD